MTKEPIDDSRYDLGHCRIARRLRSRWRRPLEQPRDDSQGLSLAPDFAIISHEASTKRAGRAYRVLASSGYVQRGQTWKMAIRQQTPLQST